ncbi:transcriptional repressor of multidrug resistance pump [Proteus mirabilis]|nr:transcriptional repressor of multidrug resistance pump [Proteus mirabilis]
MESSFTPTEELLNTRATQQKSLNKDIPYQEILLTRLSANFLKVVIIC